MRYSIAKPIPMDSPTRIKVNKKYRKYYVSPYCKRCGWSSKYIYHLSYTGLRTDYVNEDVILDAEAVDTLMSNKYEFKKTNRLISSEYSWEDRF